MHRPILTILLLLPLLALAFPFPKSEEGDKSSLLDNKNSGLLKTLVGDLHAVTYKNDVLKNATTCPKMTVLFARGTNEPGSSFPPRDSKMVIVNEKAKATWEF